MEYKQFYDEMNSNLNEIDLKINEKQAKKFLKYTDLLLYWNQKVNLTAICEIKDIITKHYIDSLIIEKYLKENSKIIDIGTGAGFPGIPLAIYREDLKITLVDSLNKRTNFLNIVKEELKLNNICIKNGRAEDIGREKEYRERFDYAVSRAVAPLNILVEYLIPFIKVGGRAVCMKGPKVEDEIDSVEHALELLNSNILNIESVEILQMKRNIILICLFYKNSHT